MREKKRGNTSRDRKRLHQRFVPLPAILRDGQVLAKEVFQRAREKWDIGERTLKEAKKRLGVLSRKDGFGKDARVYWSLPE